MSNYDYFSFSYQWVNKNLKKKLKIEIFFIKLSTFICVIILLKKFKDRNFKKKIKRKMRFKKNFRKNMQLFKLKYIRKTKILSEGIFKKINVIVM